MVFAGDDLSSDDEVWVPREQQAARFQTDTGSDALEEILQWRSARAREAAEALAEHDGGFFDFDDMPEPPAREVQVETSQDGEANRTNTKTTRQQIQDTLTAELKAIPLGDKRRRELRIKAKEDSAKAPAEPLSQREARELGRLLCVLEKENPSKLLGPRVGTNGKFEQPAPPLAILESEAIELVKKRADVHVSIGDLKRLPLHSAAERCYPKLIVALLKARADPNRADFAGETALHTIAHSGGWCSAIERDRILAIENLVELHADINFANPRGRTPLHIAASAGDGVVIKALIDEGADVNAADLGGFTPLMWASGHGRKREVEALLDAEADPTLTAKRGQNALLFALTNKHHLITDLLEECVARSQKAIAWEKEASGKVGEDAIGNTRPAERIVDGATKDEATDSTSLAKPYKWPKQTLHFPYMGQVRRDYVPDMNSNVY